MYHTNEYCCSQDFFFFTQRSLASTCSRKRETRFSWSIIYFAGNVIS